MTVHTDEPGAVEQCYCVHIVLLLATYGDEQEQVGATEA